MKENTKLAHRVFGCGNVAVVIDACLLSCGAEWWHIAERMAGSCRVLTFDRAGYGKSPVSKLPRKPSNIAMELNELLESIGINHNIVLLGHSQGGYYAVQYAAMYPQKILGIVLLDPATPFDDAFKAKLTRQEFRNSGVDKTAGYRVGLLLTSLGLGFLLKPLLKKAPPFYYHTFSDDAERYLLEHLMKRTSYQIALEEYKFAHVHETTTDVRHAVETGALGNIPLRLVTHSSGVYVQELMTYANMDKPTAEKVETIWQEVMRKLLALSKCSIHTVAPNSGHFIHLTDEAFVMDTVLKLITENTH